MKRESLINPIWNSLDLSGTSIYVIKNLVQFPTRGYSFSFTLYCSLLLVLHRQPWVLVSHLLPYSRDLIRECGIDRSHKLNPVLLSKRLPVLLSIFLLTNIQQMLSCLLIPLFVILPPRIVCPWSNLSKLGGPNIIIHEKPHQSTLHDEHYVVY
jgi:hypothetical protein